MGNNKKAYFLNRREFIKTTGAFGIFTSVSSMEKLDIIAEKKIYTEYKKIHVNNTVKDHSDPKLTGSIASIIEENHCNSIVLIISNSSKKYFCKNHLYIPVDVHMVFFPGCRIYLNKNATLTVDGTITAGIYKIFDGEGLVLGRPRIVEIYPQWFGANRNPNKNFADDNSQAFQKAINLAGKSGIKVIIPSGYYYLKTGIQVAQGVHICGSPSSIFHNRYELKESKLQNDWVGTSLHYLGNNGACITVGKDTINEKAECRGVIISDLKLLCGINKNTSIGMEIGNKNSNQNDITLQRIKVVGFDVGFLFHRTYGTKVEQCEVRGPSSYGFRVLRYKNFGMTYSSFIQCGTYSKCKIGFSIEAHFPYSSLINCFNDHAKIGFKIMGYQQNGSIIIGCGNENCQKHDVIIECTKRSKIGIIGLQLFSNNKEAIKGDRIVINLVGQLWLSNFTIISSTYDKRSKYDLNVKRGEVYIDGALLEKNRITGNIMKTIYEKIY